MNEKTESTDTSATDPAPADLDKVRPLPSAPDRLAPFRPLFGLPVAVQFAAQTPYLQIAPLVDQNGRPATVQVPGTNRVIGLPVVAEQQHATAVATGVLRPSEDGTWLVIEERIAIPRSAESLGGQALMDVYVRPEMVTHVSFVKAIEMLRPQRSDA